MYVVNITLDCFNLDYDNVFKINENLNDILVLDRDIDGELERVVINKEHIIYFNYKYKEKGEEHGK